jgi:hypothetical protein
MVKKASKVKAHKGKVAPYSYLKKSRYPLNRKLGVSQRLSGCFGEGKNEMNFGTCMLSVRSSCGIVTGHMKVYVHIHLQFLMGLNDRVF